MFVRFHRNGDRPGDDLRRRCPLAFRIVARTGRDPTSRNSLAALVRARLVSAKRSTRQPGSITAFESVDLCAMVSGYLKAQNVDIGAPVQKDDVLAR
ncbi:MAG: hypothetical protein ACREHD_03535 [Pirellulales bacterium]